MVWFIYQWRKNIAKLTRCFIRFHKILASRYEGSTTYYKYMLTKYWTTPQNSFRSIPDDPICLPCIFYSTKNCTFFPNISMYVCISSYWDILKIAHLLRNPKIWILMKHYYFVCRDLFIFKSDENDWGWAHGRRMSSPATLWMSKFS